MARPRRILRTLLVAALSLLGVGALAGGVAVWQLGALARERGVTWRVARVEPRGLVLEGVTGPGLTADRLRLSLVPWRATVAGLVLEAGRVGGGLGDGGAQDHASGRGPRSGSWVPAPEVVLGDVAIAAGGEVLATGLSGRWSGGALALDGPGVTLRRPAEDGTAWRATWSRPVAWRGLQGEVHLVVTPEEEGFGVVGRLEGARLEHALLARQALPLGPVHFELQGSRAAGRGTVRVEGVTGDVAWTCSGQASAEGLPCAGSLAVPPTPAATALGPFAPLVPELTRAEVAGQLGLTVTWDEQGRWVADPLLEGLVVRGAVPSLDTLRRGRFEYRARTAQGYRVRATGEGTQGWTPLAEVGPWLPRAVEAAEDVGFRRHPGYDVAALREALAANAQAGRVVRGGSTLTQQLAKNLFLDGQEQTLARKISELLLATELDRELGKERVLELYLNVVELGPELWGVAAASERYFLKRPANLQPHEAAFLAAILPAPRTFYERWYLAGRAGSFRVDHVLAVMGEAGTLPDAGRWQAEPLRFVPP